MIIFKTGGAAGFAVLTLPPVVLAVFITYKSFKTYKSRIRVALERFGVLFFTINRAYLYSLLNQSAFAALSAPSTFLHNRWK
ncbi:MAG TPA: hypothetical protein VEZ52_02585 [Desulfovibrio sp.]|uniref:hypothetical protein n=1 Tax=Desulfovibrio sp. TaxID=885 RepID=UPI002D4DCB11|nr:hypothetical protein [Desulfovibrio sp.]HZF60494.1 hypothetical protein [Desulfovibrio sp.]